MRKGTFTTNKELAMKLRDVEFGPVTDASGVRGFFGEGYPYHRFVKPFGLDFEGSTLVAKTTTLAPREGNMPLKHDGITPHDLFPSCVVVKPLKGIALNAVGLSGPGADFLFRQGRWQQRTDPFFLSFMSVEQTREERTVELREFVKLFATYLPRFRAQVGLQINYSCPNVGLHVEELAREIDEGLLIASSLNIPLMPKLNVVAPVELALKISQHSQCDALCVSNTIPWGQLSEKIDWETLFGTTESPLAHLGGGGLSGAPLLSLVFEWVKKARSAGITKPINAGGGILQPDDVDVLHQAGASSVFLGSIAMLRGWRVRRTIARAQELSW